MDAADWADAWHEPTSNQIIIAGKPVDLVEGESESGRNRVINFVTNPEWDFNKIRKESPKALTSPRKKFPADVASVTQEQLQEKIKYVVLHSDLTRHTMKCFKVLVGRDLSTHFGINWNGVIYQFADVAVRTFHAGSEHNDVSIGIDMNHMLARQSDGDRYKYFMTMRSQYAEMTKRTLQEKGFKGRKLKRELDRYRFENPSSQKIGHKVQRCWGYSQEQYTSLILLLRLFVRELKLEKSFPMGKNGRVIPRLLEEDDLKELKGFVGHYHISDQRWDPGPALNWERILSGLTHANSWFPLAWERDGDPTAMVLQGKDAGRAAEIAYDLCRNNEKAERGGTYPLGPNTTWHGGVHLFPPQEEGKRKQYRVHAMFDGVVMAAHFEENRRELGHNNFVLLRHTKKLPKRKAAPKNGKMPTIDFTFYSLYMHLDSMGVDERSAVALAEGPKRLNWVKRLYELEAVEDKDERQKLVEAEQAKLDKKRQELTQRLRDGQEIDEEFEDLVLALDEDDEDEDEGNPVLGAAFLTVGAGSEALSDPSKIAVLWKAEGEFELKIAAGDPVGMVGMVGGYSLDEEGRLASGVHVEVFTDKANFNKIDLDVHGKFFRTPQRARGNSLLVETEDILNVFRDAGRLKRYQGVQVWPDTQIDPGEIVEFFSRGGTQRVGDHTEAYREQFRRSISYHVSEWSDKVDWIAALTGGVDWSTAANTQLGTYASDKLSEAVFSKEIRKFLPFVWFTKELAGQIGLEDFDGRVYHYHPIHFVMWMTYYAAPQGKVFKTPLNLASFVKRQKREQKVREYVATGKQLKIDKGPEAFDKWDSRKLPKLLTKKPFYYLIKSKKEKDAARVAQHAELLSRIRNLIASEVEDHDHDALFGVVDNADQMYMNPKEVLQDLYELPPHLEWKIKGREDDG